MSSLVAGGLSDSENDAYDSSNSFIAPEGYVSSDPDETASGNSSSEGDELFSPKQNGRQIHDDEDDDDEDDTAIQTEEQGTKRPLTTAFPTQTTLERAFKKKKVTTKKGKTMKADKKNKDSKKVDKKVSKSSKGSKGSKHTFFDGELIIGGDGVPKRFEDDGDHEQCKRPLSRPLIVEVAYEGKAPEVVPCGCLEYTSFSNGLMTRLGFKIVKDPPDENENIALMGYRIYCIRPYEESPQDLLRKLSELGEDFKKKIDKAFEEFEGDEGDDKKLMEFLKKLKTKKIIKATPKEIKKDSKTFGKNWNPASVKRKCQAGLREWTKSFLISILSRTCRANYDDCELYTDHHRNVVSSESAAARSALKPYLRDINKANDNTFKEDVEKTKLLKYLCEEANKNDEKRYEEDGRIVRSVLG